MTTLTRPTKEIRYDRLTRDFAVIVNGECIGYAPDYTAGERLANEYAHDELTRTATALDGGAGDAASIEVAAEVEANIWSTWPAVREAMLAADAEQLAARPAGEIEATFVPSEPATCGRCGVAPAVTPESNPLWCDGCFEDVAEAAGREMDADRLEHEHLLQILDRGELGSYLDGLCPPPPLVPLSTPEGPFCTSCGDLLWDGSGICAACRETSLASMSKPAYISEPTTVAELWAKAHQPGWTDVRRWALAGNDQITGIGSPHLDGSHYVSTQSRDARLRGDVNLPGATPVYPYERPVPAAPAELSVDQQLAEMGLKRAGDEEDAWDVTVVSDGQPVAVRAVEDPSLSPPDDGHPEPRQQHARPAGPLPDVTFVPAQPQHAATTCMECEQHPAVEPEGYSIWCARCFDQVVMPSRAAVYPDTGALLVWELPDGASVTQQPDGIIVGAVPTLPPAVVYSGAYTGYYAPASCPGSTAQLRPVLSLAERIQKVAGRLAKAAAEAGDARGLNAISKASLHLAQGVRLVAAGDAVLVPSGTAAGVVYRCTRRGAVWCCTCKAGLAGGECWHALACELTRLASEPDEGDDDTTGLGDRGAEGDDFEGTFIIAQRGRPWSPAGAAVAA